MSFTPSPMTPNPPTAVLRSVSPPPLYSPDGLARRQFSQEERGESSDPLSVPTAVTLAAMDTGPRIYDSSTTSLGSVQSSSATMFKPNTSYSIPSSTPGITVTPLHLLGDQADTVDCPFCRRRAETKIKKNASAVTHIAATGLFLTTIGGVVAPYAAGWKCHISHFCTNCGRKVAVKRNGSDEVKVLGTPEHLREVSRFPAAVTPAKRK
ncbi:unnamed protein product [Clonostachys rosea]|uniref:LITAF domain-containing protein n=1 Tax=Bionectria ochroleuca TaxID=29856 RepID=A0ABY6U4R3_BIOOC|nr:unnamed protein product [Clonostachys rosea]